MNNNEEITYKKPASRRKFVFGVAVLSVFAAIAAALRLPLPAKKNVIACAPESKKKTVRMLTQDGKLVEIDESLITGNRKKINAAELQQWIKYKSTPPAK
jgi:hypothetical protein